MSEPFLGEIKIASFGFPPKGWALCDGQLLPINQNQALFSILGTTYGGDGRVNFGLPNLQGSIPTHTGNGFNLGERGGEESHTLTLGELTAHSHPANCNSGRGSATSPSGAVWAQDNNGNAPYGSSGGSGMSLNAISTVGGFQSHNNLAPFLTLNFIIALQGIFPSQN
jgi:microcystin-dependent protein